MSRMAKRKEKQLESLLIRKKGSFYNGGWKRKPPHVPRERRCAMGKGGKNFIA